MIGNIINNSTIANRAYKIGKYISKTFALNAFAVVAVFAQTAYQAYQSGDYNSAVKLYSEQIANAPKYAPSYYGRALAYAKLGMDDKAIIDFGAALDLDAKNADAFYGRGLCYTRQGDNAKALEDFNKAVSINSSKYEYYYALGNVYYYMEQDENSVSAHSKAIDLNPAYGLAYYGRGIAYKRLKQLDKALNDLHVYEEKANSKDGLQEEVQRVIKVINEEKAQ
jgi:tetratricopeptide (TPR) repeat protein